MADQLGMSETEIINIHKSVDYKIYMPGFLPGYVYLGGLDERIHMPRLDVPRTKIPERYVGIGGNQTGVYPMESPGGWRLIGSTPLNFYNLVNNPPVLCEAGEYIRFDEDVMVAYTGADMQAKLDEEVIPYISSANVACGFHASDPLVMAQTVRLGVENHTAIGAHPGYPDLVGFGRRNMAVSAKELKAMVQYQVGALQAF